MVWAIEHPQEGIVEPEEMDFERVLEIAYPYLGDVVGVFGDWTPLEGREQAFPGRSRPRRSVAIQKYSGCLTKLECVAALG